MALGARNETSTCELYNGSICQEELLSMTRRYLSNVSEYPSVVTGKFQGNATSILALLDLYARPECSSNAQVRPFICLHFFGLCDTGIFYQPCASQCKNIRDNICMDEWRRLASFVRLPNCDDLELINDASLICDEQEIKIKTGSKNNVLVL